MNVQFKLKKFRYAIIDPRATSGKVLKVGIIEEYEEIEQDKYFINVKLFKDLPEPLKKAITEHPQCLRMLEEFSLPEDVMFIPSRDLEV